jgi:hypothetical protein
MIRRLQAAHDVAAAGMFIGIAVGLAGCMPSASTVPSVGEAAPPAFVVGCLSIEQAECEFVAEQVKAVLPGDRGAPFAIQINLYGCPNDGPCPRSLAVRDGTVTAEYLDGRDPIALSVAGPPQAPRFGPLEMGWSGLLEPSSPRVDGAGPFPFDVGHCGLAWQVDFDGSFWLLVGQVDGDASPIINNDSGRIRLLAPNLAEYRNGDFVANLARFPGPKHVFLCR